MPLCRAPRDYKLVVDEAPYFDTLDKLDKWATNPPKKLTDVVKYSPSGPDYAVRGLPCDSLGKLLVCHDYEEGYKELEFPSNRWYTFNYWSSCDTFVYFSHHRVTVPPSGWVNAAHRQGAKILGTLIFEGSDSDSEIGKSDYDPDVLQIITGPIPKSQTVSVQSSGSGSIALSSHYARVLTDLAYQRGFDGYLLNFECALKYQAKQGRALASWITVLESQLKAKVGPHAQVIWYDSDVYDGSLSYQEDLDSQDLPFFIPSTGFFSDYKWDAENLLETVQCMETLKPQDLGYITTYRDSISKSFRDIFIGIDVWGRGSQLYSTGFKCYKAFPFINSANAGLSSAVFAPGWTWESTNTLTGGYTWNQWFDYDKMLWVGPNDADTVPGNDDAYMPICKFFPRNPPPNPTTLAFHTTFCPGIGLGWFVNGTQVLHTQGGWTDVQKQTSLGDMLWPTPMLQWSQEKTKSNTLPTHFPPLRFPQDPLSLQGDKLREPKSHKSKPESDPEPSVFATLRMVDKAWNGGSCAGLAFFAKTDHAEGRFPIQSFALTPGQEYNTSLIYNHDSGNVKLVLDLTIERLSPSITQISVADTKDDALTLGWHKLHTRFFVSADHPSDVLACIGLKLTYDNNDPGNGPNFSLLLGQMNVTPVLPPALDGSTIESRVLWAEFETTTPGSASALPSGTLTWDITTFFDQSNANPDNTKPPWTLQNPESWLPKFLYFNIYAQAYLKDGSIGGPERAGFMGTTGLDGRANRFFVDSNIWPDGILGAKKAMLYVQGVTDHGNVLPWDHCAFITINL